MGLRELDEVKEKYREELLKKANVVGVGVGYKIRKGVRTSIPCIIVLVTKKLPKEVLSPRDLIPEELEGVPTDVVESGDFYAYGLGAIARVPYIVLVDRERTERFDPVPVGVSIGNEKITSGTSNILVEDEEGELFTTSNAHVLTSYLATCERPKRGEAIYQPGRIFGGTPKDNLCARLAGWEPIVPTTINGDFAWARIRDDVVEREWINVLYGLGVGIHSVVSEDDFEPGTAVVSDGLNGVYYGKITALHTDVKVHYGCHVKLVKDCIVTTRVGAPGSSGSPLLIESDPGVMIGYLFAGSSTMTAHTPALKMLAKHGLKLVPAKRRYNPAKVVLEITVKAVEGRDVVLKAWTDKDEYYSGEEAKVSGWIKDKETENPIAGAPIYFYLDSKRLGDTKSDESGEFAFKFRIPYVPKDTKLKLTVYFPGM